MAEETIESYLIKGKDHFDKAIDHLQHELIRTITIQPFDKTLIKDIETGIIKANIGLNPQNDGEMIRLSIPPLTEERRKELVKQCKHFGEDAKVSVRQMRHKLMDFIKKEVKDGYPEDAGKRKEQEVEDMVHDYTDKIDKLIHKKEEDIMTV